MLLSNQEKKKLTRKRPPVKLTPNAYKELKATEILAEYSDAQLEEMSYEKIGALVDRSGATIRQRVVRNGMPRRAAAICVEIPKRYAINGGRNLRTGLVAIANENDIKPSTLAAAKTRNPNKTLEELAREIKTRKRLREGLSC